MFDFISVCHQGNPFHIMFHLTRAGYAHYLVGIVPAELHLILVRSSPDTYYY